MTYLFQRTKTVDARKSKIKWKISFEGFFYANVQHIELYRKQNNRSNEHSKP